MMWSLFALLTILIAVTAASRVIINGECVNCQIRRPNIDYQIVVNKQNRGQQGYGNNYNIANKLVQSIFGNTYPNVPDSFPLRRNDNDYRNTFNNGQTGYGNTYPNIPYRAPFGYGNTYNNARF